MEIKPLLYRVHTHRSKLSSKAKNPVGSPILRLSTYEELIQSLSLWMTMVKYKKNLLLINGILTRWMSS